MYRATEKRGNKMTREEAINKWVMPAIKNTWNEKKCGEIIEALEQVPCDVCKYNPPSSGDGKPCTMCPAESEDKG